MELYLDREKLLEVARDSRSRYASASPFPHIALDGLFPDVRISVIVVSQIGPS
jgi:hypothetical protein